MSCNEWKNVKIDDICDIRRGASPRPIIKYVAEKGIPWVKIADATSANSRYISNTKEYICEEGKDKSVFIKKGDLILSNSATPGIPKFMGIDACIHDGWLLLNNFKQCNKMFLYYKLVNDREKLLCNANGSVFKNLKTDIVKNHIIKLPPLEEQEKIATILSCLDDKIELNNEMNKTLEEMAQSIFKRWFVDFEFPNEDGEPYKSSGGEMVDSELGMIPKGWEVKTLDYVGDIVSGGTPSTKNEEYYGGDISWITPKDLSGYNRKFISKGERCITELGLQKSSAKLLPKGTVLFSSRAPIGYVAIAEKEVSTNQGFKSVVCNEEIMNNNYVYYFLKYNKENIENVSSGSTFKEISGSHMKNIKIIVPSKIIIDKFNDLVSSFDSLLKKNYEDIDTLEEIRDSLLPKLMSGEIQI